jgi:hypothetical protein
LTELTLPLCLLEFLDANMPALGGAATVRFQRRAPREMPFRRIIGAVQGIAFFGRVHLREDRCEDPVDLCDLEFVGLLLHELVHIEQQRSERLFYPAYFAWLAVKGYERNPYEVAAEERAGDLLRRYVAQDPCATGRARPRSA